MNNVENFERVIIHEEGKADRRGIIIESYPYYNTVVGEDGRVEDIRENNTVQLEPLNTLIETKDLKFPKLSGLDNVSLVSTMLKLSEEAGELAQVIGKGQAMSGERTSLEQEEFNKKLASELLDVAQTTVTMMFVLEKEYGMDIQSMMDEHYKKLIKKGYIK